MTSRSDIPDEAVEAALCVYALESLQTPCDVGRVWDMGHGCADEPTCSNAAEWSALAHDCHLGQPILLCTKHLAMGREDRRPEQFIKWRCRRCKLVAVSADELIWNVRRIA
jgi:hypothetical protein